MCSPRERRIRLGLQEEFLRRGRFAPRHRLRGWLLVLHCAADCPWRRRYARNCPRPLRIDSIGVRVRPRGQFAAACHLAIVSAASLRFRRQHPRLVNLVETERTRRHWRHSAVLKSAGQSPIGLLPLDSSSSAIPSFRFRPLLRASRQLRPREVIAGGLRAVRKTTGRKTSSKPGTGHSRGKIYRYEIPNHVLTIGAYPNTKMMTIPTGSTYFM